MMTDTTPPAQAYPVLGLRHRQDARALAPEQLRFEIDMCIGCDRCMLACPVPSSALVSIADLNHATVSGQVKTQIAQFTSECVLCGSCVPVCPVDNHRDLLMLSLKQRLGSSWESPVDLSLVQATFPAGWNVSMMLGRLRELPLFHDPQLVPDSYLLHLLAESRVLFLAPGTVIMREGAFGRDTYVILEGQCELSSSGIGGKGLLVGVVGRGEYVGDYAMLTGQRHALTVCTQTAVLALAVPEQTMQRLMEIAPHIERSFEQTSSTRSLEPLLQRLKLFQGVARADVHWLAGQVRIRPYERGDALFTMEDHEKPAREYLHVLLEGFVKVARRVGEGLGHDGGTERIIAYRHGGDYFAGGLDVLGDRGAVSVSAITRTRVAEIAQSSLLQVFSVYPLVLQRFNEQMHHYGHELAAAHTGQFAAINLATDLREQTQMGRNANPLSDAEARAGLHALVDDGVIEGTEVLVIDLDRLRSLW